MGYTHYWYQTRDFTRDEWSVISSAVNSLIDATDVPLGNWEGSSGTVPDITPDWIRFNGIDEDSHETFALERIKGAPEEYQSPTPGTFAFCKTAAKPYDVIVVAALIIANHLAPGALSVSSDGDWDDWLEGQKLAFDAVGDGTIVHIPGEIRS